MALARMKHGRGREMLHLSVVASYQIIIPALHLSSPSWEAEIDHQCGVMLN